MCKIVDSSLFAARERFTSTIRPLVTGSLISSDLIMFSTTCRIIVFACVVERAADLPMRSSTRTIHLFDSGRLGQSQDLDADTAWQLLHLYAPVLTRRAIRNCFPRSIK